MISAHKKTTKNAESALFIDSLLSSSQYSESGRSPLPLSRGPLFHSSLPSIYPKAFPENNVAPGQQQSDFNPALIRVQCPFSAYAVLIVTAMCVRIRLLRKKENE